jgi:hypothetical protein
MCDVRRTQQEEEERKRTVPFKKARRLMLPISTVDSAMDVTQLNVSDSIVVAITRPCSSSQGYDTAAACTRCVVQCVCGVCGVVVVLRGVPASCRAQRAR